MGAVLASDAFFPFSDGPEAAGKAGVTAIIQPGGSKKDADSIAMADTYNIAMVLTGDSPLQTLGFKRRLHSRCVFIHICLLSMIIKVK